MRKARKAKTPHRAPAFPATVKARISSVSGAHFVRKIIRNIIRSRSRIFSVRFFKVVLCSDDLRPREPRYSRSGLPHRQSVERRRAGSRAPLFVFFCVTGQGGLLAGARDLTIVEQRNQENSSDGVPESGRKQETSQVSRKRDLTGEDAYQDLRRAGYTVDQTPGRYKEGQHVNNHRLGDRVPGGGHQPGHERHQPASDDGLEGYVPESVVQLPGDLVKQDLKGGGWQHLPVDHRNGE